MTMSPQDNTQLRNRSTKRYYFQRVKQSQDLENRKSDRASQCYTADAKNINNLILYLFKI